MPQTMERLLLEENELIGALQKTKAFRNLSKNRKAIQEYLAEVHAAGDIGRLIAIERACLERNLEKFANSKSEISSLSWALVDISAIEIGLENVANQSEYRKTAERFYSHPRSIRQGVPYDETSQSFTSHITRLGNMTRARLDDDLKTIVELRLAIFKRCKDLYIDLQKDALGITQDKNISSSPNPKKLNDTNISQVWVDPLGQDEYFEGLVNLGGDAAGYVRYAALEFERAKVRSYPEEEIYLREEDFKQAALKTIMTSFMSVQESGESDALDKMLSLYKEEPSVFIERVLWNAGVRAVTSISDEEDSVGVIVLPEECGNFIEKIEQLVTDKINKMFPDETNEAQCCI